MASGEKKERTAKDVQEQPERAQTDESLRTERENTDRALARAEVAIETSADTAVEEARNNADTVLETARDKADSLSPHAASRSVVQDRAREDEALRVERASADERLRLEREKHDRVLSSLLPLERANTDRYLLSERVRSDDAVANRDDFLSMVSHDLRNLLAGIVMGAELVSNMERASPDGSHSDVGGRIQRYAARMNRLLGDLLDVGSIDAGRLAVSPVHGDVDAVIEEAADTFRASASAKNIALETELPRRPLPAKFDHDRLVQVLANLLANAIKFTPDGGRICVRGESAGAYVQIDVCDTGCGIPPEMQEAVFERFRQVGEKDRRGLGLGLYISRCLVEAHGGRIWAESTPGHGSRFCLTLPASPVTRAPS